MRNRIGWIVVAVFALALSLVPSALASWNYADDFSTNSGLWTYVGSANRDAANHRVELTRALDGQAGIAWLNANVQTSFTAEFDYYAGGGTGADGIDFLFFKQTGYAPGAGGTIGFNDVGGNPVPGYGIEFDNWYNPPWDADGNHIALIKDSYANHLVSVPDSRTEGTSWHHAKVDVNTFGGTVKVWVDGDPIINWAGAIDTTHGGMGFSAATGSANNLQLIDNVRIEVQDPCTPTPTLGWQAPLSSGGTHNLPVGGTLPIAFAYGSCSAPGVDDSTIVQVINMADPSGLPVTTWVMGYDITYDAAAHLYRVNFRPSLYGLAPGANLQVQVYVGGALVGTAAVHITP